MYVCNCNGVTRREVDEAISAGALNPEEILAHHGCAPCCGRCLPEMAVLLGSDKCGDPETRRLAAVE